MPAKPLRSSRFTSIPEAPTYYPTEQEFTDPLAYIAKIRAEAEQYGACKIVPPASWNPPFVLDKANFKFKTRVQSVHELQERSTAEDDFEEDYLAWLKESSKTWKGPPMVNGRELDLYKLFRVVSRRGGYRSVCEKKSWRDVCKLLQVREKSGNASYIVKQLYQKHLLGYEARCQQRGERKRRVPSAAGPKSLSSFDKIVAAAKGKEDIDVLGAVAALMDVPANESVAHKRQKLETLQAVPSSASQRIPGNIHTMVCELCRGGHREDKMVLCDKCDRGCHIFCLQPPLAEIPEGTWVCPLCVAEEVDTRAFREGKVYTFEEFERVATEFKAEWFDGEDEDLATSDIEQAFWHVVENGEEPVEVLYGADIDTSQTGSGFPVRSAVPKVPMSELAAQYAESPWNLNNLPRLEGSLLKHLADNIAGVTLPWMYMGMMLSSFCWHIEDHMFYSINYNHWGAPKRWYTVPASAANAFEAAFKVALPELVEKQPDVLFHLVTMLSPRILQTSEVPVYGITQGAGEFVVTFPCSYHGGFNMGLNCAEAVNFAPADWLRYGGASMQRIRNFRKQPILSHAWLLLKVAAEDVGPEMAFWASKDLRRVIEEETELRFRLRKMGCWQARQVCQPQGLRPNAKDDAQCAICHSYLHLSGVECKCCPKRFACMRHARDLCDCPPYAWRLAYRHSLVELQQIAEQMEAKIPPELSNGAPGEKMHANGDAGGSACSQDDVIKVDGDGVNGPSDHVLHADENCSTDPQSTGTREPGSREQSGTPECKCSAESQTVTVVHDMTNGASAAPIPRKRDRKAARGANSSKRPRTEAAPDNPPQMRLTRAAIKAEEEAQDTLDVLSALTGLANMVELDGSAEAKADSPPRSVKEEGEALETPAQDPSDSQTQTAKEAVPEDPPSQPKAPTPEVDAFNLEEAQAEMASIHRWWLDQGNAVFEKGGYKAGEVEALIQQAQQFLWAHEPVQAGVADLVQRLRGAQAWAHKIHSFLKTRPSLEDAEAALSVHPAPVAVPGLARFAEGVRIARSWTLRASELSHEKAAVELRALEALAAEGQRLPVVLPQLKGLKDRLATAKQLVDAVKLALPLHPEAAAPAQAQPALPAPEKMRSRRKKHQQQEVPEKPAAQTPAPKVLEVTIEWLRILRNQAATLKVQFPDLARVNAAISEVEAFQARVKEALQIKPSLPLLHTLLADSEELVATVPEMQRIRALVAEAKTWLNKASNVRQPRTALKKMREVLHSGLRLGSELPQVEELRQDIRRREWEDHARKAMTNKQTMAALVEVLEDAAGLGAEETELGKGVRQRLEQARFWEDEAARFFSKPGRAPLYDLEALVMAGNELGVKMEQLTMANQALHSAVAWSRKAEQAAAAHLNTPIEEKPTLGEVHALLGEYQALVVALPEAESLSRKHAEADEWAKQAQEVLSNDLSEDKTDVYEKMVADGWATGVQMNELVALQDCLAALEWMKEVRKYSIITPLQPAQKQAQADLHASDQAAEQKQEESRAENAAEQPSTGQGLEGTEQRADGPAHSPVSKDWEPAIAQDLGADVSKDRSAADEDNDRLAQTEAELSEAEAARGSLVMTVEEAKQLLEEGEGLPVDQKVLSLLRQNLAAVHDWEDRLSAVSADQVAASSQGLPREVLMPLVEEARKLPLQPESLPALEDALSKASVWQARAARLFRNGDKPSFAEVVAIAASGRSLLVRADCSQQVDDAVAEGEAWREACRKALAKRNSGQRLSKCIRITTAGLDMALTQLNLRMQEESARPADSSCLSYEEAEGEEDERKLYCVCQQPYDVDTAMISCDSCEEWFHCRCIGLSQTMARSIKRYVCPVCIALKGNAKELQQSLGRCSCTRRPTTDALQTAISEAGELPCVMEEVEAMKHMLSLFQRFSHLARLLLKGHEAGLAAAGERSPPPMAQEQERADPQVVDEPLDRTPSRDVTTSGARPVAEASAANSAVHMSAEEEFDPGALEALDAVLAQDLAADLEAAQKSASGGPGSPPEPACETEGLPFKPGEARALTSKTLSQLAKSALSLEITADALQAELLAALKQHRWRQRADVAIQPHPKLTVDGLNKLQREGEVAGIDMQKDHWGSALSERVSLLQGWLDQAEQIVEELAEAEEDRPTLDSIVKRAEEILRQGRGGLGLHPSLLPRGFDKELSKLEEACKLYCLCQLPYNEERPMLSCDYCQEWFHYDCVGLRAPSDDEDDEDVAPKDYQCPKCCQKAGKRYPRQEKLPRKSLESLGIPEASEEEGAGGMSASRLHELLTPSQAQALGEAQQAMLGDGARAAHQPAHSWLLSVLAQQRRLRPTAPASQPAFLSSQAAAFPGGSAAFLVPNSQAAATFVLPQISQSLHALPEAGEQQILQPQVQPGPSD